MYQHSRLTCAAASITANRESSLRWISGDFAHAITARATLDLPPGWRTAASGSFVTEGKTTVLHNDLPLIDIAFTASPLLEHQDRERVSVYHAGEQGALTSQVLSITTQCSRYLEERYGQTRHLPPVKMVIAPRGGPGYARKNYIVITHTADTATIA